MSSPRPLINPVTRPSLLNQRSLWISIAAIAIVWSAYQAGIGRPGADIVNWGGLRQLGEFWTASLTPDLGFTFLNTIGRATLVTFAYAVCGTLLSISLGFFGGVLSSQTWWQTVFPRSAKGGWLGQPIWLLVRGLLTVPRAIHELIWGLFFLNIFGLDPLVAVLAIAVPFGAIVAKVFSEILDETPQEPLNGLLNSGVSPSSAWLYGLLPQALPNLLSYSFYRFECSLRAAAVLGVIGAGGLGYEILLSLQSLRYHQLWTGFYALILLNGAVDMWSAWVRRRMGFTSRLDINARQNQTVQTNCPRRRPIGTHDWTLGLSWCAVGLAIPLSFWGIGAEWQRLWSPRTGHLLGEVIRDAAPQWPNAETVGNLIQLSGLTLAMSVLAIALAGIAGILLSFPAAQTFLMAGGWLRPMGENSERWWIWPRVIAIGSRIVLLVSRAIPAPIWALVCLFVLFPGILPGALALAVHNFGILGRLMAEVNENLDDRPLRSLHASGASAAQAILYGVLPQNLGRFLAYILYRWEVCLRETAIVGLVGAGGLGRLMTEQLSSFDYGSLTLTLGCFLLLTLLVDFVSQKMRLALR